MSLDKLEDGGGEMKEIEVTEKEPTTVFINPESDSFDFDSSIPKFTEGGF